MGLPLLGKMKRILFILLVLVPAVTMGCRSTRTATSSVSLSTSERHTDSVVQTVSVTESQGQTETETVVTHLVADSTGTMRETARDIVRTVTRTNTKTMQGDTAVFRSEMVVADTATMKTETIEEKPAEARQENKRVKHAAFGAGMWTAFSLLAVFLGIILYLKWKSRL